MPETPDFEQMAHAIASSVLPVQGATFILHREHIAEQLRFIWNARGAADIATIDAALPGASVKTLDALLRLLDR
jgi:hypothetical protein